MSPRKKTRRYEASRRNGHYTPSQQTPTSSSRDNHPPSITKARRRLQFGRKPPKFRGIAEIAVDSDHTDEMIQSKPPMDEVRLHVPDQESVQTTSSDSEQAPSNRKRKNTGVRLKKELEFLLDDADHVVYPVRLRSTLHSLMSCPRNKGEDVTSSNKSQKHMELSPPSSSSRQH